MKSGLMELRSGGSSSFRTVEHARRSPARASRPPSVLDDHASRLPLLLLPMDELALLAHVVVVDPILRLFRDAIAMGPFALGHRDGVRPAFEAWVRFERQDPQVLLGLVEPHHTVAGSLVDRHLEGKRQVDFVHGPERVTHHGSRALTGVRTALCRVSQSCQEEDGTYPNRQRSKLSPIHRHTLQELEATPSPASGWEMQPELSLPRNIPHGR